MADSVGDVALMMYHKIMLHMIDEFIRQQLFRVFERWHSFAKKSREMRQSVLRFHRFRCLKALERCATIGHAVMVVVGGDNYDTIVNMLAIL